eukprot:gene40476-64387_t
MRAWASASPLLFRSNSIVLNNRRGVAAKIRVFLKPIRPPLRICVGTSMANIRLHLRPWLIGNLIALALAPQAFASSHREAPFITKQPKVDATDFYMFRSYEPGREKFVTLIANYVPLQDAYGGPNYFAMDPDALYEIHIDNNGDAKEDLTFQFRFSSTNKDTQLTVGGKK